MTYAEHFRALTGQDMTQAQRSDAARVTDLATAKSNLDTQIASVLSEVRKVTGLTVTVADIAGGLSTNGNVSSILPSGVSIYLRSIPPERLIELARQDVDPVTWAFRRFLGRDPKLVGTNYYTAQLVSGRPVWEVVREIELSDEARAR